MRRRQVIAIISVLLLITVSSWLAWTYITFLPADVELRVQTEQEIATINQLVGVNDYGPDVTELYEDQVAYDLFQSLGLQRLRVWCQFGTQLAEGLGWGWHHTIFTGSSLADAQNPLFYNWTYLDLLFEAVNQTGADPILTFTGCPLSLAQGGMPHNPPIDNDVYAEVVARVVMHYLQGWPGSTGPIYAFDYVEIGNEPNFLPFWNGSMQEFLDLYTIVSQRLEQLGEPIKIGGPGLADIALTQWTTNFLSTVTAEGLSLDFFSWHAYYDDPSQVVQTIQTGKTLLIDNGFGNCERVFDEWGLSLLSDSGWGTMEAALHATDVLIGAAHHEIDIACCAFTKDVPVHPNLAGIFGNEANYGLLTRNPTTPKPTYHALTPFAALTGTTVLSAALVRPPLLALFPLHLTCLVTRGVGQHNYSLLFANHEPRTITCRLTLLGAPTGPYNITTSELSNTSITQHSGWTPVTVQPPSSNQSTDLLFHIPPQSCLWITLKYTGSSSSHLAHPQISKLNCLNQHRAIKAIPNRSQKLCCSTLSLS